MSKRKKNFNLTSTVWNTGFAHSTGYSIRLFNRKTMVVNDHFIKEGHLWQLSPSLGQVVTPHSIAWKVISKLNWTKILVYSSTLQCKEVQLFTEKFHWSKKLRKTENFSFNLNISVPLESVNLFLHFFCVWRSFWQWNTTWSYSQFSSENWQYFGADNLPCEIWDNLPQRHFFTCNRLTATIFEIFILLTSPRIR